MWQASMLFAPDARAVHNLERMRVRGRIVPLSGNTSLEAVRHALGDGFDVGAGPVVVTMHRVENLHNGSRVEAMVDLIERIAVDRSVASFCTNPPKWAWPSVDSIAS